MLSCSGRVELWMDSPGSDQGTPGDCADRPTPAPGTTETLRVIIMQFRLLLPPEVSGDRVLLARSIARALGWSPEDWNNVLVELVSPSSDGRRLQIPQEQVMKCTFLEETGNTTNATEPLSMRDAIGTNLIRSIGEEGGLLHLDPDRYTVTPEGSITVASNAAVPLGLRSVVYPTTTTTMTIGPTAATTTTTTTVTTVTVTTTAVTTVTVTTTTSAGCPAPPEMLGASRREDCRDATACLDLGCKNYAVCDHGKWKMPKSLCAPDGVSLVYKRAMMLRLKVTGVAANVHEVCNQVLQSMYAAKREDILVVRTGDSDELQALVIDPTYEEADLQAMSSTEDDQALAPVDTGLVQAGSGPGFKVEVLVQQFHVEIQVPVLEWVGDYSPCDGSCTSKLLEGSAGCNVGDFETCEAALGPAPPVRPCKQGEGDCGGGTEVDTPAQDWWVWIIVIGLTCCGCLLFLSGIMWVFGGGCCAIQRHRSRLAKWMRPTPRPLPGPPEVREWPPRSPELDTREALPAPENPASQATGGKSRPVKEPKTLQHQHRRVCGPWRKYDQACEVRTGSNGWTRAKVLATTLAGQEFRYAVLLQSARVRDHVRTGVLCRDVRAELLPGDAVWLDMGDTSEHARAIVTAVDRGTGCYRVQLDDGGRDATVYSEVRPGMLERRFPAGSRVSVYQLQPGRWTEAQVEPDEPLDRPGVARPTVGVVIEGRVERVPRYLVRSVVGQGDYN